MGVFGVLRGKGVLLAYVSLHVFGTLQVAQTHCLDSCPGKRFLCPQDGALPSRHCRISERREVHAYAARKHKSVAGRGIDPVVSGCGLHQRKRRVGELYKGFLLLERMYCAKTGKHLPFVPIVVKPRKRIAIGQPVFFADGDPEAQMEGVIQELQRALSRLEAETA